MHLVGVGGIGVSAAAKLLKYFGAEVSGSDLRPNEATAELRAAGIPVAFGHAAANVPAAIDLLVHSDAVPESNPERVEARRRGVRELSYFAFLGEFSAGRRTVAVSGTNGKSTTTALLGLMLERAGLDPTVIVGSKVNGWPDRNLRYGQSDLFVVEACEHHANMLRLSPRVIVLTNIEEDHLDYYRDLAHIRETFQAYIERLPPDGKLILNADDHVCFHELRPTAPFVTYGLGAPADYAARVLSVGPAGQEFRLLHGGAAEEDLGICTLPLPGLFNVHNALAAAAAALQLGATPESVRAALSGFTGLWRRFERLGDFRGCTVVSDYGHHPAAIRETLAGARQAFPRSRIVLVFQPHQRHRTRVLFNEFVAACDGADLLVLPEIFDVAGRERAEDSGISSADLASAVRERDAEHGRKRGVFFRATLAETEALLHERAAPDDLLLLMGAGDIHALARSLVSRSSDVRQ